MTLPLITVAQVIAQDPDQGALQVQLRTSGQQPSYPVKMLYRGAADGLRINQEELPGRGTWGVVVFPYGDTRNGLWLGAFYPSQIDAISGSTNGTGPTNVTDSFIRYLSHWSGFWNILTASGEAGMQFPDGSWTFMGSGAVSGMPTAYRHVVDGDQSQKREEFTFEQRVTSPPSAYNLNAQLLGAATLGVSGDVQMNLASGFTTNVSGAYTFSASGAYTVNASGNISINGAENFDIRVPSGKTVTITAGSTQIKIDTSGNIVLDPGGSNIHLAGSGDSLALVSKLVSAFNSHTHAVVGVLTGGGAVVSQSPGTPWTAGTVNSAKVKAGS